MKQELGINIYDILEVAYAFNGEVDYFRLLNVILEKMRSITGCDAGTLYILEEDKLHFRIMHNDTMKVKKRSEEEIGLPPIMLDADNIQNVSAYCAIRNEMVNIPDVYEDTQFNFKGPKEYDKITGYRTKSMLVFPLASDKGQIVGVMQLINAKDHETGEVIPFGRALESVLQALSNIAAVTLTNIRYAAEIRELFYSFVKIMSKAIDERTPYNVNHTNKVAKYAGEFAEFLTDTCPEKPKYYFTDNRKEQLVMAALMHDIGKVVTPSEVMDKPTRLGSRMEIIRLLLALCKAQDPAKTAEADQALALIEKANTAPFLPDETISELDGLTLTYRNEEGGEAPILSEADREALRVRKGTLTPTELSVMQNHVVVTGSLLDSISFNKEFKNVPGWARRHHEFLDGTGYPDGISGDALPVEVRILTILDIYDALVAEDRPYKKAMPQEKAVAILTDMAKEGKLDEELVTLFARYISPRK